MADIFPFQAYRYDTSRFNLAQVLTQPYDKITPEMQSRYYSLSPENLIRVEKGLSSPDDTSRNNVYTRAAQTLEDWVRRGVLQRDPHPAVYAYSQEYNVPGSDERRTRIGFIALGRVSDYSDRVIFRHEQTLSGPKADRLKLLRRTRAHTGQLFMLYDDLFRETDQWLVAHSRSVPTSELYDEFGVAHRLWMITDSPSIARLRTLMAGKSLLIADGHHRYETALAFRDESRLVGKAGLDAPHEKVMMTFVNLRSTGLTILPTHRLVRNLPHFEAQTFLDQIGLHFESRVYRFAGPEDRARRLAEFRRDLASLRSRRAIGLYAGDACLRLLTLRPSANPETLIAEAAPAQRRLDVVLLHRLLLEKGLGITPDRVAKESNVVYERDMERGMEMVDAGQAQLCWFLNPVPVEEMAQLAFAGEVLPQKSTDFYPKLLSGLTIYRLDS